MYTFILHLGLLTRLAGIFQKLFTLFEEACHQLDLKLVMHWKEKSINSLEYEAYSSMLSNLSAAKCELDSLKQEEEMIQQVETYSGISRISVRGVLEREVLEGAGGGCAPSHTKRGSF